jgi:hypothetical protein
MGYFCGRIENLRMLADLLDIVAAEVFSEQLFLTSAGRVILFSLPKLEFLRYFVESADVALNHLLLPKKLRCPFPRTFPKHFNNGRIIEYLPHSIS